MESSTILISLFLVAIASISSAVWRRIHVGKSYGISKQSLFLRNGLRLLLLLLLGWQLFSPTSTKSKSGSTSTQDIRISHDVYLAVDMSFSMLANDISPSRLSIAKLRVKELIKKLPHDRIGLITFASGAYLLCPLSLDHSLLLSTIDNMSPGSQSGTGTDLNAPLEMVLNKFKKDNSEKGRTIVLVSDGEDFGEPNTTTLSELSDLDVKIVGVAVGTEAGGQIPIGNNQYKRNKQGDVVTTKVNTAAFRERIGSDAYFVTMSSSLDDLDKVSTVIKTSTGAKRTVNLGDGEYGTGTNIILAILIILLIASELFISLKVIKI